MIRGCRCFVDILVSILKLKAFDYFDPSWLCEKNFEVFSKVLYNASSLLIFKIFVIAFASRKNEEVAPDLIVRR